MDPSLAHFIEKKMRLPVVEGDDKRCSLKQAIERHVKENMVLHFSHAGALVYQLIRSFWDRQPAFTVVSSSLSLHTLAMLKRRLARKFIVSFAGIGYPSPRPCPVVQNAYREGKVRIENWTMRTIPQRLLAGALGWDFMPTRSLAGSSMTRVKENVGWSLKVAPQLTRLDPPDASSMALLRLFDPRGHFIGSTV